MLFCECETLPFVLREECRLRIFQNGVLWGLFGPKKEKVIVGWRKLYNEEHNDFYFSKNITRVISSRRMRLADHVACMGGMRNTYRILENL
jgi:hypothetical protein